MEPFFATVDTNNLHPALVKYIKTPAVQSASFDPTDGKYHYSAHGNQIACGGLVQTLKYRLYPHYKDNRSYRRNKKTNVRGSSKEQGKRVDSQLLQYVHVGKRPKRVNPMTSALLDYWHKNGHELQAAQVPVPLRGGGWNKMTQADIITRNTLNGNLCLWEVKTGMPVGGFRTQDNFKAPLSKIKCTKYNIWQLQVHYTRIGLEEAEVPIKEANVIQVYSTKDKGMQIKVHSEESWLKDAPSLFVADRKHAPVVL
jgi:hypothetical protein